LGEMLGKSKFVGSKQPRTIQVTTGRRCGDCSLCCKLLKVEEFVDPNDQTSELTFYKPELKWCPQCTKPGCAIYETRPVACKTFRCAWLEGFFDEEDRPDRVGFVTAPYEGEGDKYIRIIESRPLAHKEKRAERAFEFLLTFAKVDILVSYGGVRRYWYNAKTMTKCQVVDRGDRAEPLLVKRSKA
jgi:Fe-S-cluster containining protein